VTDLRAVFYAGKSLDTATYTLQQMAGGGMYDQIGGGFHRYSVDEHWHIPHFEKMLYDNPQLASTYLDAFAVTGDRQFAEVARGILDYLRRDMTHPKGGIFSAEVSHKHNRRNLQVVMKQQFVVVHLRPSSSMQWPCRLVEQ